VVEILGELMVCKSYARRLGALPWTWPNRASSCPSHRMRLSIRRSCWSSSIARDRRYKLTPDLRLVRTLAEDGERDRLRTYRAVLQEVLACGS